MKRSKSALRGQATVEYAATTTILLLGALGLFAGWPFTTQLFRALQLYVDFFFYALDLAVG